MFTTKPHSWRRNLFVGTILLAFLVMGSPQSTALILFDDAHLYNRAARMTGVTRPNRYARRIIVFGDSLSDSEGRLAAYTQGVMPPSPFYWQHRLSNGPLWSEYLAAALSLPLVSYAVAGARLSQYNNYGFMPDALSHLWAPPFAHQRESLDQDGVRFDADDLVFLWIGNNDFLFSPYPPDGENYCDSTLAAVADLRQRGARRLVTLGVNDVSLTPFSRRGGSGVGTDDLRHLTEHHNSCVAGRLKALQAQNPGEHLDFISLSGIAHHIISHPQNYSLSDTENPCLTSSTWPTITIPFPPLPPFIFGHLFGSCPEQNSHFFWDAWHPNTIIHCIATLEVLKQLGLLGRITPFDEDPVSKRCF